MQDRNFELKYNIRIRVFILFSISNAVAQYRFENDLVVAVGKGELAAVMSSYGFK